MATLVESADTEALGGQADTGLPPASSGCSQHFNDGRFYLLVVIAEVTSDDHLKCAIADIEKGKMELVAARGGGHGALNLVGSAPQLEPPINRRWFLRTTQHQNADCT